MHLPSSPHSASRRAFLQKTAGAGLAAIALPAVAWACAPAKPARSPADQGLVFLFQGDSITDGNRGRNQDPNHIMGHGYAFSIASRLGAEFPEKNLTFINKGISGNKITDLAQRWQEDALALKPDVLSILVGVNDAASVVQQRQPVTLAAFEQTYDTLLTETKELLPQVILVLGLPFILPVGRVKENWEVWHQDLVQRQKIVQNLAQQHQAVLVDYQEVFDQALKKAPGDYWIWDGIHPTVAGHELMARQWLKQVSTRLPFVKGGKG